MGLLQRRQRKVADSLRRRTISSQPRPRNRCPSAHAGSRLAVVSNRVRVGSDVEMRRKVVKRATRKRRVQDCAEAAHCGRCPLDSQTAAGIHQAISCCKDCGTPISVPGVQRYTVPRRRADPDGQHATVVLFTCSAVEDDCGEPRVTHDRPRDPTGQFSKEC